MSTVLNKKKILSWCLYDWANSAFILCVATTFFPDFFKKFWSLGVDSAISTARLGFGNASAGLIVALFSPFLGALAHKGNSKIKFLAFFMFLGVFSCSCLYFIPQGSWFLALILFIIANTGYLFGNLFYDSLLINVSNNKNSNFVSSLGFSTGYLGSSLLFIFFFILIKNPKLVGLTSKSQVVLLSFLIVGIWWFLFSLPLLTLVKLEPLKAKNGIEDLLVNGIKSLKQTIIEIKGTPIIITFLIAYWLYIDGVNTIIVMANDFLITIGIPLSTRMFAILLVQVIGFPASILFGLLAQRIGAQKTISIAIGGYIVISIGGAWFIKNNPLHCYLFAGLIGTFQGALQALSRSLFASMIPPNKETSYFGFYNMVGRFAVIMGPAVVAGTNLIAHSYGISAETTSRLGISSVAFFFIVGLILLSKVNLQKE